MAAVDIKNREDLHLEAGLRSTQEEEKVPFISNGHHQDRNSSSQRPLVSQQPRTMSPLKRVAMFLMLSLSIGVVLSMTQDASMSCLGWHRESSVGQGNVVRSVLAKRQNAGTNTTSSDAPLSTTSVDSTTSTSTTTTSQQTSDSTTSSSTTSSQSNTTTSTSVTTSSSTTQTPPTSTSTSFSNSTTTSQSSSVSSSDVTTTSSDTQKTITTGSLSTSSPVPHTLTTTLPDGGTLTITSVSWVAVVPSDAASGDGKPKLQNAAAKSNGHIALVMVLGALSVGVLVI